MNKQLSILLLEDSELDAELIRPHVVKSGIDASVDRVITRSEFQKALDSTHYDLILSDYSLPDFDGITALAIATKRAPETLFIFVSGTLGEELAIEALQNGASDYILKQRLSRLGPAVRRAFEEVELKKRQRESERALHASQLRFRELADAIPQMICATDARGHLLYANRRALVCAHCLALSSDLPGEDFCHPDDRSTLQENWRQCLASGEACEFEFRLRSQGTGDFRWHLSQITPLHDGSSQIEGWIATAVDVEEQKQREEALKENQKELIQARETLEEKVRERTVAYSKLSVKLLSIQDEERRKFARELHDGFGQSMVALKMNVDTLYNHSHSISEEKRRSILGQSCSLLEQCVAEVRTISYLLHPPLLDEAGFAQAADWYANGFEERTGITISLIIPEEMQRLPSEIEIVLFRVLQASLSNVHLHAEASQVEVSLDLSSEFVKLKIWDNGVGVPQHKLIAFRRGAFDLGVGLAGMRERVRDLGGSMELNNENGTTINVKVPLLRSSVAGREHSFSDSSQRVSNRHIAESSSNFASE